MSPPLQSTLRQLRIDAGMTQTQLAERLAMTQAAVSKIESGSRAPSRDALNRWIELCGHSLEISGTPPLQEHERELLRAAAGLSPDDFWLVAEAIRGLSVVTGSDRTMARQSLRWLADRAPTP